MSRPVLLVDDDPATLLLAEELLAQEGIATIAASTGRDALRRIQEDAPGAVLLDLMLPDMTGRHVLADLKARNIALPVIMLTAQGDVEDVVSCMRLGATDYIQKPVDKVRLVTAIKNALRESSLNSRVDVLTNKIRAHEGFASLLGAAPVLKSTIRLLGRCASTDVTVLLTGESGTGKERAARAIHAESQRFAGPFVAVNCGAIPDGLVESVLFGHEKGAFTGATAAKAGYFEQAQGGTILLDEVTELASDLQVKLLRVLQERVVQRVGSEQPLPVDVRVIGAANRDLKAMIEAGTFRSDLYYRLAVFPIELPALRTREGDAVRLAETFLTRFARKHGRRLRGLSAQARQAVATYSWPGNIRQLENAMERAVLLEDGETVSLGSLPDDLVEALELESDAPAEVASVAPPRALNGSSRVAPAAPPDETVLPFAQEEQRIIERALRCTGGNVTEAARRLGIGRATMYRKIERYASN